jgi:hypothetical protein
MNNRMALHILTVVCLLALAACGGQTLPAPTPSPEPTNTPLPTATSTPQPTFTPAPTAQPTLTLGERQRVDAGGYSFQVPSNFETQIRATQATISNKDATILISMVVAPRKDDAQTVETVLAGFLANVTKDVKDLEAGEPYLATVGDFDGLAANVTGTLFGAKNSGRVTVVDIGQPGFFIAFAFVVNGADGKRWESEGSQVFNAILNSIQFFTPVSSSTNGSCPIASDPSYGYTKDNPIKVGGGDFDGPPRERAYLDNLAGPKGEKISYERTGSIGFGDTILDAFVITGLSKKITLYIDEYSYTEPQAPVGFTCLSAFPLAEP